MSYMMGKPDHWYRVERDGGTPYFVRPAGRTLLADEPSPTAFVARWMEARSARKSDRNGALSAYRWPLDFRPVRWAYRAQKAAKWRLPRFRRVHPRRFFGRLQVRFNLAIDRWLFDPDGNPMIDRLCHALFAFVVLYLIAQMLRA